MTSHLRNLRFLSTGLIALLVAVSETAGGAEPVDYLRQVKPLLAARCGACHGALRQQGGLRLDTAAAALRGGDSGPSVVAEMPARSELIRRVRETDESTRMPQEGEPLKADEIALLEAWIAEGAAAPQDEVGEQDPLQHWSYQPPTRPVPPSPAGATAADATPGNTRPREVIDLFLDARIREAGLTPLAEADRETLLRRVTYDLTGLPPTRDERRAFLDDSSPDAYERLVDRLLDSPAHAERWGRHLMDVWRYSDWYGRRAENEIRYGQYHIWRWRDWIVDSLAADKGYDRMILEMLAGDELAPDDPDVLRATGFLGRNWYKFDRDAWLFETVEQTSVGILGATMRCARCHDHKYDPLAQRDYYGLRAFFEPHAFRTDSLGVGDAPGVSRAFDETSDAPTYLFIRGDSRQPVKDAPVVPATPPALGGQLPPIEPVELPWTAWYPDLAPTRVAAREASLDEQLHAKEAALAGSQEKVAAARVAWEQFARGERKEPTPSWLDEPFDSLDEQRWQVLSGEWSQRDGQLSQTADGSFLAIVTRDEHPADFRVRLVYETHDPGDVHSVGFSFDASAPTANASQPDYWQAFYSHSQGGDSGVHLFHRVAGADSYPAAGTVTHPVRLGQRLVCELAARGDLVNVWMDGELKLAYRLPTPRRAGRVALWTHRSGARFFELRVAELPASAKLAAQVSDGAPPPFGEPTEETLRGALAGAEHAAQIAAGERDVARLERSSFAARVLAERARHVEPPDANDPAAVEAAKGLREAAARGEQELESARASLELQRLEGPPGAARDEAKLKAARERLDKAAAVLAAPPGESYQPLGTIHPRVSSGRRLALARWMVDPEHPRTARVIVNHVWLRHFGRPLVDSVDNFGLSGKLPSHPELLDWLARDLVEHGWSLRRLHRQLVLSAAYRRASGPAGPELAALEAADPTNQWLARSGVRRMEAEVVRDSFLALAGDIDSTIGGPELDERLGETTHRRSLYYRVTPDNKMPLLELFDLADPNQCYRRQESIVPQQALALANSDLAWRQARRLAAQLEEQLAIPASADITPAGADEAARFIGAAYERILGRAPDEAEQAACLAFLDRQAAILGRPDSLHPFPGPAGAAPPPNSNPRLRAREDLVQVLLNLHDFITIR